MDRIFKKRDLCDDIINKNRRQRDKIMDDLDSIVQKAENSKDLNKIRVQARRVEKQALPPIQKQAINKPLKGSKSLDHQLSNKQEKVKLPEIRVTPLLEDLNTSPKVQNNVARKYLQKVNDKLSPLIKNNSYSNLKSKYFNKKPLPSIDSTLRNTSYINTTPQTNVTGLSYNTPPQTPVKKHNMKLKPIETKTLKSGLIAPPPTPVYINTPNDFAYLNNIYINRYPSPEVISLEKMSEENKSIDNSLKRTNDNKDSDDQSLENDNKRCKEENDNVKPIKRCSVCFTGKKYFNTRH